MDAALNQDDAGDGPPVGIVGPSTGSTAPADKTAKGRATRRAFQQGGRTVIARDGYVNARIADIAEAAGKSVASFYNYYDSKEDLLVDIAADFDEELQALVARPFRLGLPVADALRAGITDFWFHYKRRLPEVIGIFHASLVDPVFAERWREIRANGTRAIARGIRSAQADGFAPGLDSLIAGSALSAMMEYFCYVWQARGGDAIDSDVSDEAAIDTLWTLWMHAVYWKGPEAAAAYLGGAVDNAD